MGRGDAPNITGPSRKLMWFAGEDHRSGRRNVALARHDGPVDDVVKEPADRPAPRPGPAAERTERAVPSVTR